MTARRQKAISVINTMDTDAIISMLERTPRQDIPTSSYEDLMKQIALDKAREIVDSESPDDYLSRRGENDIFNTDYSPRFRTVRASDRTHPYAAKFAIQGDPSNVTDRSRIVVEGPGKMVAKKPSIESLTTDAQTTAALNTTFGGDEGASGGDDDGWI